MYHYLGVAIENFNMDDASENKKRKIDGDKEVNKKPTKLYPCDQCEYSAAELSNLKTHTKTKHEGIRYSCDQLANL